MMRLSASRLCGSCSAIAATALAGVRCAGIAASFSIIALTRDGADRTRSGMAWVSGRFGQYFFAMWPRVTARLTRAGLKVLS